MYHEHDRCKESSTHQWSIEEWEEEPSHIVQGSKIITTILWNLMRNEVSHQYSTIHTHAQKETMHYKLAFI